MLKPYVVRDAKQEIRRPTLLERISYEQLPEWYRKQIVPWRKITVNTKLPLWMVRLIDEYCEQKGISRASFVFDAIIEKMKREKILDKALRGVR